MSDLPFTIVSREAIGLDPVVRSSSGAPRPPITDLRYITVHWPGVDVRYGDIGDTAAEILAIETWAQTVSKPNEYNWVNHQDPDDLIFTYAGNFRAAHSAGENDVAAGVLFLNGLREPFTALQWSKFQWLRDVLRWTVPPHSAEVRPHRQMPGAATACPGPSWDQWKANAPFVPVGAPPPPVEPPPPVTPVDPPDALTDAGFYLVRSNTTPWRIAAECYGTGTRWPEVTVANLPDTMPNPGERWRVPGFAGAWTKVLPGEGPWSILDRLFGPDGWNKSTGVQQFWVWNGGDPAFGFRGPLRAGEQVWVRS